MNAVRTQIRAKLVDAASDLNYRYRQGQIGRAQWIRELRDLEEIGKPVGWQMNLMDVVLSELHAMSRPPDALTY